MKPSEFRPEDWPTRASYVVRAIRQCPPTGVNWREDRLPAWARSKQRWLNRARFLLLQRDGTRCQVCEKDYSTAWDDLDGGCFPLDIDHLIPLSQDGPHDLTNMRLICGSCHRAKTRTERGWS